MLDVCLLGTGGMMPLPYRWLTSLMVRYNGHSILIDCGEVKQMPMIRPSSDLRNSYNEISEFCHQYSEPVYITKNGTGDLAVMSIETYERLVGRFELYGLLEEGLKGLESGQGKSAREVFETLESRLEHDL